MSHRSHKSRRDRYRDQDERDYEAEHEVEMDWREQRDEVLLRNGFATSTDESRDPVAEALIDVNGRVEEALQRQCDAADVLIAAQAEALSRCIPLWRARLYVVLGVVLAVLGGYVIRLVTE